MQTGDAVSIMTIHAAKGLEFDTVFMPAWEEGIFPNEMAIHDGGLEEERRLAYVAITRARNRAVISHAMSRMVFGSRQYNPQSRFIGEIDKEFTECDESIKRKDEMIKKGGSFNVPRFTPNLSMIGKLVHHSDLGAGVVIEENDDILMVAFKDKGIKKVAKQFVKS
jgi:DNA helicase-2/ATP-dependent DNA helicase PcrA